MKTRRSTTRSGKPPARKARVRKQDGRSSPLALGSDCTVAEAGKLRSRLVPLLACKSEVTLDVSAVRRVDAAGMQLLAAFVRERRTQGLTINWRGSAPAIVEAAQLLGLASFFDQAVS